MMNTADYMPHGPIGIDREGNVIGNVILLFKYVCWCGDKECQEIDTILNRLNREIARKS